MENQKGIIISTLSIILFLAQCFLDPLIMRWYKNYFELSHEECFTIFLAMVLAGIGTIAIIVSSAFDLAKKNK